MWEENPVKVATMVCRQQDSQQVISLLLKPVTSVIPRLTGLQNNMCTVAQMFQLGDGMIMQPASTATAATMKYHHGIQLMHHNVRPVMMEIMTRENMRMVVVATRLWQKMLIVVAPATRIVLTIGLQTLIGIDKPDWIVSAT
jgi:hypothetical protein